MDRYVCIHGHFYQPPRENPWLDAIEVQDSAHPYHDWNERITAECYAPNASSRILDHELRILEIVSNYQKISFNIGPTLISWLEKNAPDTYQAIQEADRLGREKHGGHGPALAQAYNHLIMPLANSRDKRTQILWGLRDFQWRFKRPAAGIWLPETAVDLETLDLLAANEVRFTILAPSQAFQIRKLGTRQWQDVSGGQVDPTRPYLLQLESGRSIVLFFYDGPISQAVAFERLLERGEDFAHRLLSGFSDHRTWPQLMHIATDGESYGHHHRHGEMALSYALHYIESNELAQVTNYGEYLEKFPPSHEVQIYENSSWSCIHGVERWQADCGCNSGGHPGWHQAWRAPLREALDWLREELATLFSTKSAAFFKDPWAARDDYISVILDRSETVLEDFFDRHQERQLTRNDWVRAIKLLELQRQAMQMYTSCGWFFDEISGLETVQILEYAGRAIQLAHDLQNTFDHQGFLDRLARAPSNLPEHGNGAEIYQKYVVPAMVDLEKVGVHYAISSLFEEYTTETMVYSYEIERLDFRKSQAGSATLVTGRSLVASELTGESETVSFAALYFGTHDINCGIRRFSGAKPFKKMTEELHNTFENGAFSELVRLMDTHFGMHNYSFRDLFKEEQRRTLENLISDTLEKSEQAYRRLYEDNRLLVSFLKDTHIPIPKVFHTAAHFILNLDLKRELQGEIDPDRVQFLLGEFKKWNATPEAVDLEFVLRHTLERKMAQVLSQPENLLLLEKIDQTITIALQMPFEVKLWTVQNMYYRLAKTIYLDYARLSVDDEGARAWVERFRTIGGRLNFNLESILRPE